jgi:hypothetical protein
MAPNLFISNFKKLPIAFLGTVLLIFITHFILQTIATQNKGFWQFCYLYSEVGKDDPVRLEAQIRMVQPNSGCKKIFLVGGSQTREGYDVKYLNEKFKKNNTMFYNFGVSDGVHPIDMVMLKNRLIKKNPDSIVYMPYIGSFYSDYQFSKMNYYCYLSNRRDILKYLKAKNIIIPRDVVVDSFVSDFSIFYKYRKSFVRIFCNAFKQYFTGYGKREIEKYVYKENKPFSYFREQIKEAKGKKYEIVSTTELEKVMFNLFAKDIILKDIEFIVVDSPAHPLIKKCYKEDLRYAYNCFLSDQAREIDFIYLSENQLPRFTEDDFVDFLHLNKSGRKKLSEFLGEYLTGI